jgi:imidazolonepropionase-like amidohydrolase
MVRRALLVLACLIVANAASAQEERRHTVLTMGKPSGMQTLRVRPDGAREIAFEFNDRGRGPKLTMLVRVNEAGLPTMLETQGVDYLKAPVEERFSLENGRAQWRNTAERGEKNVSGRAYYLSMQFLPEELGLLAQALLKAPDGRLVLLPEGEARIRAGEEVTLTRGSDSRRVRAYEIEGLGFTPNTVWLDEQGQYFATVTSWFSYAPEGWESSVPTLLAKQEAREAQRTAELARTLARKPDRPVAIVNANLFDSASGRSHPGSTIVIDGARILDAGPAARVRAPANAEVIDARGRTALPGLWDMHVHMSPNDGLMHIAGGVTSVRDLANDNESLLRMKKQIDAGAEIGPRIIPRGFMDGSGPYAGPTKVLVDTEEQGRAAIEMYAKLGYDGIKIYSSIKPELAPVLIRMAHEKGLRVSGHVPAFMTAEQFVRAGADELQHINFVFLNFFDDVKDTRTPARFTTVAERAATLDLASPRVQAFAQLLKERGVVVDPTVAVFESMFTDRPGVVPAGFAPIAARLPPQVRRGLLVGGLPTTPQNEQRYRDSADALLRMVKLLHDAGVTLVAGTDSMPGFTLHRELELYVQAGIPAPEVLRIATSGAARVAGRDRDLGAIAAGKLADLILVAGNPAQSISDIRRTALVVKDGRLYEPAALYRAIGVQP